MVSALKHVETTDAPVGRSLGAGSAASRTSSGAGGGGSGSSGSSTGNRPRAFSSLRSKYSAGRVALPRTPGLGPTTTMGEMLRTGAVPAREGVILTDKTIRFADLWRLADKVGAEYGLSREGGRFILRSGAADTVPSRVGVRPTAHTHLLSPLGEPEPLPSIGDINVLNDLWRRLHLESPDAPRPRSTVIWGPEPHQTTQFGPTGFDLIPGKKPR
jgi:hypothetical protein